MISIPPDLLDILSPSDWDDLFPNLDIPDDDNQMYNVFNGFWNGSTQLEQNQLKESNDKPTPLESNSVDETNLKVDSNGQCDASTLSSPGPFQLTPRNINTPWVHKNQKRLQQALGIDHNKPGPRPGQKKGKIFKKELKKARGCPLKMTKVREKHRHLFEGNCKRAMEQRIQEVFSRLLAAPHPALAAPHPLMALDVQFAHRYYDIDLVALATPP